VTLTPMITFKQGPSSKVNAAAAVNGSYTIRATGIFQLDTKAVADAGDTPAIAISAQPRIGGDSSAHRQMGVGLDAPSSPTNRLQDYGLNRRLQSSHPVLGHDVRPCGSAGLPAGARRPQLFRHPALYSTASPASTIRNRFPSSIRGDHDYTSTSRAWRRAELPQQPDQPQPRLRFFSPARKAAPTAACAR